MIKESPSAVPRYAAIILAAGHSTRFGSNKLKAHFKGKTLLSHAIAAAQASPASEIFVITRKASKKPLTLEKQPLHFIQIDSLSLSSSLKAGVEAARSFDGIFVFLGDMPLIPHTIAAQLASAIGTAYAAIPCYKNQPGHPVLLSSRAFADITALSGDKGAGGMLRNRDDIIRIHSEDSAILFDVDYPEDIIDLQSTP